MLFWLDSHYMQLNVYKWFRVLQLVEPKRAHITPFFISLHWLPLTSCIKFKALTLDYRQTTGYQKPMIGQWATAHGTITKRHKITLQNILIHSSLQLEWSPLPNPECRIPDNIQKSSENLSLPWALNLIKICFPLITFLFLDSLPCLAYATLSDVWNCILSTSCFVCLFMIVLICKLLWIKSSAKWLNVKVKS